MECVCLPNPLGAYNDVIFYSMKRGAESKVDPATAKRPCVEHSDAITRLSSMIAKLRRNPELELEVLLASYDTNTRRWQSSHVDADYFKRITEFVMCTSKVEWEEKDDSERQITEFYHSSIRRRTSRSSKSDIKTSTVIKRPVDKYDLPCGNRPYGLRFTLKTETKVNPTLDAPPKMVRVGRRWSSADKFTVYSFTKVSSGATKEIATKSPARWEVEMELKPTKELFDKGDDRYLARVVLRRATQLLGDGTDPAAGEPIFD